MLKIFGNGKISSKVNGFIRRNFIAVDKNPVSI